MKASLSWLKDYVEIKEKPADIAEKLTMAGISVTALEETTDEYLFEFEITANRSDCLSIIGIAREVAAITGKKLKPPKGLTQRSKVSRAKRGPGRSGASIPVKVRDKALCPIYSGRIIKDVMIGESPKWLRAKLMSVGIRPVNNVVDITNYLLMETGQPMHAFDLDKIKGAVIIRKAGKKETLKLIDGSLKELEENMLLIADEEKPIALAGVMGGLDTEVSRDTVNVFLESALFDPISVRRTARKLGISTESSYRFERKVDETMILPASLRACNMIRDIAGGKIGALVTLGGKRADKRSVKFDPERSNEVLGVKIPIDRQKKILEALNFSVEKKDGFFNVGIPASRRDIIQAVDITEEIARIYGYKKIPDTIPPIIGNTVLMGREAIVKKEMRQVLFSMGLTEVMNYSLVRAEGHSVFCPNSKNTVCVRNPLSQEQEMLTQTLLLGMMKTVSWNVNRKSKNLSIYEIGKYYRALGRNKYYEEPLLALALTGQITGDWISDKRDATFFDIKGIIEGLLKKMGVEGVKVIPKDNIPYYTQGAQIEIDGRPVGVIGKMKSDILDKFDIREDVYTAEITLSVISEKAGLEKTFKRIPKYPSVVRDISLVVGETVSANDIRACIEEADVGFVDKLYLTSMYKGKHIPTGKTGFLYRIEFRDDSKTLTDNEVQKMYDKIKDALTSKLGVEFR